MRAPRSSRPIFFTIMEQHQRPVARVEHLWRYAVKGLDRDELSAVELGEKNCTLPSDRRYALKYADSDPFDPCAPAWLHKKNFLCAFTAGPALGAYTTAYDDATDELTVKARDTGALVMRARLTCPAGIAHVEEFFSSVTRRDVRLVEGSGGAARPHHFGNTPCGYKKGSGDPRVLHILNSATVAAVEAAARAAGHNAQLHAARFRPNIVLTGLPAWEEFAWVGRRVQIGGAKFRVLSRTVRCEATNSDPWHPGGPEAASSGSSSSSPSPSPVWAAGKGVPELIQRLFPEHGPYLGVYAQVVGAGTVEVGDGVVVPLDVVDASVAACRGACVVIFAALCVACRFKRSNASGGCGSE